MLAASPTADAPKRAAPSTDRLAAVARKAKADAQLRAVADIVGAELALVEPQAAREEATMRTLKDVRRVSVLVEMRFKNEVALLVREIAGEERTNKSLRTKIEVRDTTIRLKDKEIDKLQKRCEEATDRANAEQERADRAEAQLAIALEKLRVAEEVEQQLREQIAALEKDLKREQRESARARAAQAAAEAAKERADARAESTRKQNGAPAR